MKSDPRWLVVMILISLFSRVQFAAGATFTVTNANNDGAGSLRQAIMDANSAGGKDTIVFQIPPLGSPATIQPTNYFTLITDPVIIDGWSQLGSPTCRAGIEIDGSLAGSANGLSLWVTTNCEIKGLCINRFQGNGILINQGGDHRIYGCFIGTDPEGTTDLGNSVDGIVIISSVDNLIGLLPTYSCTNRNIISGNGQNGVRMMVLGGPCSGNVLQNNHLGTDLNGNSAIPNDWNGVRIEDPEVIQNDIGGVALPKPVNVISGNGTNGVYIYLGGQNNVLGNHIGVTRLGNLALSNGKDGVVITNASGCAVGNSGGEARNIIAGNGLNGIEIQGAGAIGNFVQGNYIGVGTNGFGAIPNARDGVVLSSECTQNIIGDTIVLGRNLISGNDGSGIRIDVRAYGNFIRGNYIGVNRFGLGAVTNREHGILLDTGANGNWIGNTATTNAGNLIAGNGFTNTFHGICIQNGANGNTVVGNRIGLGANNLAVPNAGDGIRIQNAGTNTVGGTDALDRNFISGNAANGIQLGTNATYNTVLGNFIGLDTNGVSARPNGKEGISIYRSQRNRIGTSSGASGNVIAGNAGSGIMISDNVSAHNNSIQNNRIGTAVDGASKIGNNDHGVYILGGVSNQIGDTIGNVIAGNIHDGVQIQDAGAMYNLVCRNKIGVDALSAAPLGNGQYGVSIFNASRNTIGGTGLLGNVIGGNGDDGVHISGASAVSNTMRGNSIGVDVGLSLVLSNRLHGVWIGDNSSGNIVGGTNWLSDGNHIWFNGACGIRVVSGTNNTFLGNSIFSNALLGIDLGALGVTPNDVQDPDTGANLLQNYPVLYEATTGSTLVAGMLNSQPLKTYRLEFFLCALTNALGYGDGYSFRGTTNIVTDANGNVLFEAQLPATLPTGSWVTVTATDPYGNTSEFAKNVQIIPHELYGDADGDSIPTRWEGPNHLDPNDGTGTNGAAGDPDGDGVNNYDEYVSDTSPSDSNNYFRIVDIRQPSNTYVTYMSTNTRYYLVTAKTNFVDGVDWTNVFPLSVQGSNNFTTAEDVQQVATCKYYRVQVQLVP
jgi:hypothetical protein